MLLKSSVKRFFKEKFRDRLVFDSTGKALIYESKWTTKGIYTFTGFISLATLSNIYSYFGTNDPQYFGELSKFSADFLGTLGVVSLVGIVLLAPRLVSKIHLMKNMSQAEITYFQVFKPRQPEIISVDELKNFEDLAFNFHRLQFKGSWPIFLNMYASSLGSHSPNHKFLVELLEFRDEQESPEVESSSQKPKPK